MNLKMVMMIWLVLSVVIVVPFSGSPVYRATANDAGEAGDSENPQDTIDVDDDNYISECTGRLEISEIAGCIAELPGQIVGGFSENVFVGLSTSIQYVADIFNSLDSTLKSWGDLLEGQSEQLEQDITGQNTWFEEGWLADAERSLNTAKNYAKDRVQGLVRTFGSVVDSFLNLSELLRDIGDLFGSAGNFFEELSDVAMLPLDGYEWVANQINSAVEYVDNTIGGVFDSLIEAVTAPFEGPINTMKNWQSTIDGWFAI